jgi:hypothetical protein
MPRLFVSRVLAAVLVLGGCGYSGNVLLPAPAPAHAAAAVARKPFIVISFARPDADYAPALYDALKGALARRPDVAFDLVAVTRDADAARRELASVVHSLAAMGLPGERMSLASVTASGDGPDEVRIYLR